MKIALCLSGQPRGIPLGLDFLDRCLIKPNNIEDVFFHAWHDELKAGQPYNSAQPNQVGRVGHVKPNTTETLVQRLNPKKYVVEPQKEFPDLRGLKSEPSANQELLGSNFYSVFMANELKKQWEQEQGFVYDIVVRTRFDMFYCQPVQIRDYTEPVEQGKIVVRKKYQDDQDNFHSLDLPMVDVFAFGNSRVMDVFSSVYPNMTTLNSKLSVPFGENYLGHHVRVDNNIELYKAPFEFEILHRVVDLSKI